MCVISDVVLWDFMCFGQMYVLQILVKWLNVGSNGGLCGLTW